VSDLAIMSITLGGFLAALNISLFLWQKTDHAKSSLELKQFQMENTRMIQQLSKSTEQLHRSMEQMEKESRIRHEENMTYFQGIMQSIARIIRKQEEDEGRSS